MNPFYLALGSLFIGAMVFLKVTRKENSEVAYYRELVRQAVKQKGVTDVEVEIVLRSPLQNAYLFTTRYKDVDGQAFMQKVIIVTRGGHKEKLFWGELFIPTQDSNLPEVKQ